MLKTTKEFQEYIDLVLKVYVLRLFSRDKVCTTTTKDRCKLKKLKRLYDLTFRSSILWDNYLTDNQKEKGRLLIGKIYKKYMN
jgi:hypothetical protein